MTGDELLKALRRELQTSELLREDVDLWAVIDSLAMAGLPGASELALELAQRAETPVRVQRLVDARPPSDEPAPPLK